MAESRLKALADFGQSIWYDNISRSVLRRGGLAKMVEDDGISGVTSNPTIFMKAISEGRDYDEDIQRLSSQGKTAEEITRMLMIRDIQEAAEVLRPVYEESGGRDGYVSLEVHPNLAFDPGGTVREACALFNEVGRPNVMIKVPGTPEGAVAVKEILRSGVNVNITLLFSPEHYRRVAVAYLEALEERLASSRKLSGLHSVASFFLSRIDTVVDRRLDELAGEKGEGDASLRGQAAVAVAMVTYGIFQDLFFSERFQKLIEAGGNIQRPLWASTSTKDPAYSDVKYVEALIGPYTVNTLPEATVDAFRDHGVASETITTGLGQASEVLGKISALGIDLEGVYQKLQDDGVKSFASSYRSLVEAVERKAGS